MMTHHEIVQAILDGKSLDMRDKQSEALRLYGGQVRWIEETQYKTYEVTL